MKPTRCFAIALSMSIGISMPATAQGSFVAVKISNPGGFVYMRAAPKKNARIVKKLFDRALLVANSATCPVLRTNWCEIYRDSGGDPVGYVNAKFITFVGNLE
jgi:hypothetical protein